MASNAYDNAANAINKRLVSLAKTYGIDHPAYQNYANKLQLDQVPTKFNDQGILQVKRGGAGLSEYQKERVLDLKKKGSTVSKVRKKYQKKHPEAKTRAEADKAIKAAMKRQEEINEALDKIYKYYDDNVLPADILDKYDNMRNHDTSNEEIDDLLKQIQEFDELWPQIQDLIDELETVDYLPEDIEQDIWEVGSGRLTLDGVKDVKGRLERYISMLGEEYDTDE